MVTGCAETKETRWIDAWIRWERGSKEIYNDDEAKCDDEDETTRDNDDELVTPTDTFSFRYEYPNTDKEVVDIELQGFHFESEQTWNSTGLTLWNSSERLCDYLVEQWKTGSLFSENHRFLELGSGLGRSGIVALHSLVLTDHNHCNGDSNLNEKLLCLTDGDTNVLQQLRANLNRNRPERGIRSKHGGANNHVTVSCS